MIASKYRLAIGMAMAVWCFAATAVGDAPPLDAGVPSGTLAAPDVEALAIEQLRDQTRQIRELREGRLDVAVDPNALFTIDLGSEGAGAELELLLREVGRDRKPSQNRTGRKRSSRQPTRTGDPLEDAHRELVEARAAFLALSPERRAEILSKHESRRREAEAQAVVTNWDTLRPELRIEFFKELMSFSSINVCVTAGIGSCQISSSLGTSIPR